MEPGVTNQNIRYHYFLDKLIMSPKVDQEDGHKAQWLLDRIRRQGFLTEGDTAEIRRLERRYDTQI
jgi:hypothetical protein